MNVFALIERPTEPIPLTEDNYYRRTNRRPPYIQSVGGEMKSYAICPACQNPVRLVNRTATETRSGSFYAKHHKDDVRGVADYSEHEYLKCPLANPARMDEKKRRSSVLQGQSNEVRDALVEAFDLVMSFIEIDTGIKFQDRVIEEMLDDFSKNRGYEYAAINLYNLPYAFVYMTESKDIFGCSVDSDIAEAISKLSEGFSIKHLGSSNYIRRNEKSRSKIRLLFYGHAESVKGGGVEAIVMRVVELPPGAGVDTAKVLYEKTIILDSAKFYNFYMKRKRRVDMARSRLK
ncbi:hypothetical protein HX882_03105 [Pseudomonas gingeri]|uniref:Uncharacterized protein n=1 Tax=Pseudomonas gingeri TaxID=117681 RepID=A0A7Y8C134_9PSED|nr:hypothetical protein [Pseudomonas gingeri]NWB94876.1 hypothetical protein [Pseudomonas gingeri]